MFSKYSFSIVDQELCMINILHIEEVMPVYNSGCNTQSFLHNLTYSFSWLELVDIITIAFCWWDSVLDPDDARILNISTLGVETATTMGEGPDVGFDRSIC